MYEIISVDSAISISYIYTSAYMYMHTCVSAPTYMLTYVRACACMCLCVITLYNVHLFLGDWKRSHTQMKNVICKKYIMSYSLTIEEVESLPSLARNITSYINFCAKILVSPVSCRRSFAITFAKSVNSSAVSCVDDNSLICWRASLITSSASSCVLLADHLEVQGVEVSRVVKFVAG